MMMKNMMIMMMTLMIVVKSVASSTYTEFTAGKLSYTSRCLLEKKMLSDCDFFAKTHL